MAQNTRINQARVPGDLIAADELTVNGVTVKAQRVKVHLGAAGVSDGDICATNPMPIAGSVTLASPAHVVIDNQPGTQPVSGSVAATQGGVWNVGINGAVDISDRPARLLGVVTVANLPTTQTVTGQVTVGNFPTTQPVSLSTLPALPAGSSVIGHVIVDAAPATAMAGTVAAGVADSGNPVKVGGVARTTNPAAALDGQRSNLLTDKIGRVVAVQGHARELVSQTLTSIATTIETPIIPAAGSGVFSDLTFLSVSNTSLFGTTIDFRDTVGGTVRLTVFVAAGTTLIYPIQVPVTQASPNAAWTAQLGTAVTAVKIFAQSIKNL